MAYVVVGVFPESAPGKATCYGVGSRAKMRRLAIARQEAARDRRANVNYIVLPYETALRRYNLTT